MTTPKSYLTDRGYPHAHRISESAANAFGELKVALYDQAGKGNWGHRFSSSIVIEFLIWWLHETQREGKTEIQIKDFRPTTQPGRPQGFMNEPTLKPTDIRKLAGVDPVTAERKLR